RCERAVCAGPEKHHALDRPWIAPEGGASLVERPGAVAHVGGTLLCRRARRARRARRRDPGVAEARRDAERARPVRRDRERKSRALDAARDRARLLGRVPAAARGGRRLAQHAVEQADELREALRGLARALWLAADRRRVVAEAARADPERQTPPREVVERYDLLRERHGVAEGDRRDEWAEADPLGRERGSGERRDGGEPRSIAERPPGEVIVGPGAVESELLDAAPERARFRPSVLRQDDDPDLHFNEGNAPLAPLGKAQRGPRRSHEGNAPLAPLGKAQRGPTPRGVASLASVMLSAQLSGATRTATRPSRIRTSKRARARRGGPATGRPSRTSKRPPCIGHARMHPRRRPDASGMPAWVHAFSTACTSPPALQTRTLRPSTSQASL